MNDEEVDSLLRSFLFQRDSGRSSEDTWSYARYTRVDSKGNVTQAYLHKSPNGEVEVNLEKQESEEVSVENSVVHVSTTKVVEEVTDLKVLEALITKVMHS